MRISHRFKSLGENQQPQEKGFGDCRFRSCQQTVTQAQGVFFLRFVRISQGLGSTFVGLFH